jgi:hypothetical protein
MLNNTQPLPRINYDAIQAHYTALHAMSGQTVHTLYKQLNGLFNRMQMHKTTISQRVIVVRSSPLQGVMFRPDADRVDVFTHLKHWSFKCNTSLVTLLCKLKKHEIISKELYEDFMRKGLGLKS